MYKNLLPNIIAIFCVFSCYLLTFYIRSNTLNLKYEIENVKVEISKYQNEIKLVDAEWSHLTNPKRIKTLEHAYFGDRNQVKEDMIFSLNDLREDKIAALHKSNENKVAVLDQ